MRIQRNYKLAGLLALLGLPLLLIYQNFTSANIKTHRVRFYVDPQLESGLGDQEVGRRLSIYVQDVNYVLSKQTIRRLIFDPAIDIIYSAEPAPMMNPPALVSSEEIWVYLKLSTKYSDGALISHSGNAGVNGDPTKFGGQIFNFNLNKIYDPNHLPTTYDKDNYLARQLHTFIHEVEHLFGAGSGEYYNLATLHDKTGVEPVHNISLNDPLDPYWSKRKEYFYDPLLAQAYVNPAIGSPDTRQAVLDSYRFTQGTVALINSSYMHQQDPNFLSERTNSKVHVIDARTGSAIVGATVKIWKGKARTFEATPMVEGVTDASGYFTFDWACDGIYCFNNLNHVLLIKAHYPGLPAAAVVYSIYDASDAKLLAGRNEIVIDVEMNQAPPPTTTTTTIPPTTTTTTTTIPNPSWTNVATENIRCQYPSEAAVGTMQSGNCATEGATNVVEYMGAQEGCAAGTYIRKRLTQACVRPTTTTVCGYNGLVCSWKNSSTTALACYYPANAPAATGAMKSGACYVRNSTNTYEWNNPSGACASGTYTRERNVQTCGP